VHRQSGSSTLAQLLQAAEAQPVQPAMVRDVHVDGVLCGPDGGAALRDQPVNAAVPPSVPMLLLRYASLQQGADSVAHYVHSGLRGLFSGPAARLGAGTHGHIAGQPAMMTVLIMTRAVPIAYHASRASTGSHSVDLVCTSAKYCLCRLQTATW
jgi:hypothetical protein